MTDMILYFFAALGVCFLVLELFRSYGKRRVSIWFSEEAIAPDMSEPDIVIICPAEEKDIIIAALADKYGKISVNVEKTQ